MSTAYETVKLARRVTRSNAKEYIDYIFTNFIYFCLRLFSNLRHAQFGKDAQACIRCNTKGA